MGTPDLSLRTRSNFTLDGVLEGVAFARAHGKRAYLTLNLFSPRYRETAGLNRPPFRD
jgi:putative protease